MNEEMLEFQNFFDTEKAIKEFINETVPKIATQKDGEELFSTIENNLETIVDLKFLPDDLKNSIQNRIKRIKSNYLAEVQVKPELAYQLFLSDIRDEVVSNVNENFSGFSEGNNLESAKNCMRKVKSINDLFYVLHSYVTESSELWKDVSGWRKGTSQQGKTGEYFRKSILYSDKQSSKLGMDIYSALEYDKNIKKAYDPEDYGKDTDVFSLKDRTLVSVNGRGNGLVIEVDESDNAQNPLIRFHIPDVYNPKIYKGLRGIDNTNLNSETKAITASYRIKREEVPDEIRKLILRVPLDKDKDFYKEDTQEINLKDLHALQRETGALQPKPSAHSGIISMDGLTTDSKKASIEKREKYEKARRMIGMDKSRFDYRNIHIPEGYNTYRGPKVQPIIDSSKREAFENEISPNKSNGESPEERKARISRTIARNSSKAIAQETANQFNLKFNNSQTKQDSFSVEDTKELAETSGLESVKKTMVKIKGSIKRFLDNIKDIGGTDGRE